MGGDALTDQRMTHERRVGGWEGQASAFFLLGSCPVAFLPLPRTSVSYLHKTGFQGFSAQDGPASAVAARLWVELIKGKSKGSTIGYLCTDCREIKNLFTGCTIFFSEITIMDKFP